jgi:hypothetical protein
LRQSKGGERHDHSVKRIGNDIAGKIRRTIPACNDNKK